MRLVVALVSVGAVIAKPSHKHKVGARRALDEEVAVAPGSDGLRLVRVRLSHSSLHKFPQFSGNSHPYSRSATGPSIAVAAAAAVAAAVAVAPATGVSVMPAPAVATSAPAPLRALPLR